METITLRSAIENSLRTISGMRRNLRVLLRVGLSVYAFLYPHSVQVVQLTASAVTISTAETLLIDQHTRGITIYQTSE
jgi:hypothetical protein